MLVLASGSPTRRALLENAGLEFATVRPDVDERAAEQPLAEAGGSPQEVARLLAAVKASVVSEMRHGDLVIGADQVLELDGERFVKPVEMEAARRQLLKLAGRTHYLHAAAACARNGEVIWEGLQSAVMTMRPLGPAAIGRYLAAVGPVALESVGAYQLERRGVQLFDRVEGDYFAILGIPLLPLLAFLRTEGFPG